MIKRRPSGIEMDGSASIDWDLVWFNGDRNNAGRLAAFLLEAIGNHAVLDDLDWVESAKRHIQLITNQEYEHTDPLLTTEQLIKAVKAYTVPLMPGPPGYLMPMPEISEAEVIDFNG